MDTRTGANTSLSLAEDEFPCSIENEDADSDFGIHFILYKVVRRGGCFGEKLYEVTLRLSESGGLVGGFALGSSSLPRGNILCSTEYGILIVYFKMCDTHVYAAAYACDVFDVSFDSLLFEFHRYADEKG